MTIVGTGYVGLVSGACFADLGHDVTCVDNDKDKIAAIAAGRMPIFEAGLAELVAANLEAGRLVFSSDLKGAVSDVGVVFIAVGTPSRATDGCADLSAGSLGERRGTAGRDCPASATGVTPAGNEVRTRPSRPGRHRRADASPTHREDRARVSRAPPRSRQGAPALRRVLAVPTVQRHSVGRAPCPLRAATRHGPQGRRRVHRPALSRPSSRTPPQRQRGRLVA